MDQNYTIAKFDHSLENFKQSFNSNNYPDLHLMEIDFLNLAFFQRPEDINHFNHKTYHLNNSFIVSQGTLHYYAAGKTESIPAGKFIKINSLREPVILYGSQDCKIFHITELTKDIDDTMDDIRKTIRLIFEKDHYTYEHCQRVRKLAFRIGLELQISSIELYRLRLASLYHDLGKIDVHESILLKKDRLTQYEMDEIKRHPQRGAEIYLKKERLYSNEIAKIILQHHERVDGKGYPFGIGGEELLIEAKILAIADAFDALTSDRPYRKRSKTTEALKIMNSDKTAYDTKVLKTLSALMSS